MRRFTLVFLCAFFSTQGICSSVKIKQSDVLYIYDGDTFYMKCIKGLRCEKNKLGVRLKGVDTAEMKGECKEEIVMARKAKKTAVGLIRGAKDIVLKYDDKSPYGRYGRLIASVWIDGRSLGEELLSKGEARLYEFGRRDWCR